jgi:beta-lactamase class A
LRQELVYYDGKSSLYFEYLPTGTSIRVGDSTQLIGASLLKLPHVMDLYHLVELGKVNLDQKVKLQESWLDGEYGDLYQKGAGYELTIRELVRIALKNSDNTAVNAVKSIVDGQHLEARDSSFQALDVDFGANVDKTVELSARAYSSFLKCLYFACYVDGDSSQELLGYLSTSVVGKERIPKYLPPDVSVAHKIGVLGQETQGDCGIVYLPKRNYVLCVMLKESQAKGSEVIAQLSKYVYDYVASQD